MAPESFGKNKSVIFQLTGAETLRVEFDPKCSTERTHDTLTLMDGSGKIIDIRSGREMSQWESPVNVAGDELLWKFCSDSSVNGWGWRFVVHPAGPTLAAHSLLSDRVILARPSMSIVIRLLSTLLKKSGTNPSDFFNPVFFCAHCAVF